MSLPALTAPIEEVAPALGLSPNKLKRRHRAMHETSGFPLPLPDLDWRWSVEALATWAAAPGRRIEEEKEAANDAGGLSVQEKAQREFFSRRYGRQ